MRGVAERRGGVGRGWRIGKRDPGAASAVTRGIREYEGLGELFRADEGQADALLFVIPKALFDDFIAPEVKWSETPDDREIVEILRPFDPHPVMDGDLPFRSRRREWGFRGQLEFRHLFMKKGWKEKEFVVLEAKARAPFGNPALAQDDALGAAAQGLADQGPFFKSDAHERKMTNGRGRMKQFRRFGGGGGPAIKIGAKERSGGWLFVSCSSLVLVLRGREAARSSSSPYRPPGSEDENEHEDEDDTESDPAPNFRTV